LRCKQYKIFSIPINTGCLGACTYCKTVFARGRLGSYTPVAITNRLKNVIAEGVKEIWLTSEDTGAYGRDLGTNISELLVSLCGGLNNHPHVMMRVTFLCKLVWYDQPTIYVRSSANHR
jgi:threonylcarbamoyladenosine tRNA methylthiotransferase CDKAL1